MGVAAVVDREEVMLERGSFPILAHDGTLLEARIREPQGKPCGTILFTPGITGDFHDYDTLLAGLQEEGFRVGSWNYRGHALSEGTFTEATARSDIVDARKQLFPITPSVIAIGHSLGALYSITESAAMHASHVVTIAPYLGMQWLNWPTRLAIRTAQMLEVRGFAEKADGMIMRTKRGKKIFHHIDNPVHVHAELAKAGLSGRTVLDAKVGYLFPGKDTVIGTHTQNHYATRAGHLIHLVPGATNISQAARNLNHCLNRKPGDYEPFLNNAQDAKAIVTEIVWFVTHYQTRG